MFSSAFSPDFDKPLAKLHPEIQSKVVDALELWEEDNGRKELGFKNLYEIASGMLYSIRIDQNKGPGYRLLGVEANENVITWFWVGPHKQYEKKLKNLRKNG